MKVADEAAAAAETEAEARAKATQNLADYLAKLDEQAALEQRIADIKASGLSEEDKARAIAVETELQTALNLAKQNGLTLTAQEMEHIRAATLAKTDAKVAGDAYVQSQKDSAEAIKQFSQQVNQLAESAVSGLVNDLRNGVEAGEAFNNMLNRIIDSLIQMSLQSLFSPQGVRRHFWQIVRRRPSGRHRRPDGISAPQCLAAGVRRGTALRARRHGRRLKIRRGADHRPSRRNGHSEKPG